MRSKRKLENVKLTRKFHLQYMGLWVTVTIALIFVVNLLLYLLVMQQWGYAADEMLASDAAEGSSLLGRTMLFGLTIETIGFSIAVLYLARLTSHRCAGPFIGLQNTCERIRDGETTHRQRFRSYDRLEDLEKAFNEMLDSLCPPRKE